MTARWYCPVCARDLGDATWEWDASKVEHDCPGDHPAPADWQGPVSPHWEDRAVHQSHEQSDVPMPKAVVDRANWWCSTCGAKGSGNGAAYDAWLRGHTCGASAAKFPTATTKLSHWPLLPVVNHHASLPGRVTLTIRGHA